MFGDGGKRNVEWLGEFLDRGFALGETRENGAAGGVGEGTERGVERGRRIVNHVVYYCTATGFCQAVFFWTFRDVGVCLAATKKQFLSG
jgi:hypothetical protein